MFEPMTLPMAMPGWSASAAWTETINSGAEVPKPTMVRPIRSGERWKARAMDDAPRTRNSPPATRMTRPRRNIR